MTNTPTHCFGQEDFHENRHARYAYPRPPFTIAMPSVVPVGSTYELEYRKRNRQINEAAPVAISTSVLSFFFTRVAK
jgi:hypothetical protein